MVDKQPTLLLHRKWKENRCELNADTPAQMNAIQITLNVENIQIEI